MPLPCADLQDLENTLNTLKNEKTISRSKVSCLQKSINLLIDSYDEKIKKLNEIGVLLSTEQNREKLLETILTEAMNFTNSDGGTLYLMSKDKKTLDFSIVVTRSLNIQMGGTKGLITWPNLNLINEDGSQNLQMVSVFVATKQKTINIKDAYKEKGYNFNGTKNFDKNTGYRSKSMIVVPMIDYDGDTVGVLQLINKLDKNNKILTYNKSDESLIESLASQSAIAIVNLKLIDDLEALLESFIQSIANAIDEKSPYTGGHVRKVADLTIRMATAINDAKEGKYKDVFFDSTKIKELRVAALMHDIGKITTPEYIMDKRTKLETIFDRIQIISLRFLAYKKDIEIAYLNHKISQKEYEQALKECQEDEEFISTINIGSEFMSDDKIERLEKIAAKQIQTPQGLQALISQNEKENLSIKKGTLTNQEREIINNHATVSLKMLNALPFPKKLSRVAKIAGAHHEKLNGKGYPLGLSAKDLDLESRMLALADIFEALSASDRPYKEGKTLSEIKKIIDFMVKDGDLDADLIGFFYEKGIDRQYAQKELKPKQLK